MGTENPEYVKKYDRIQERRFGKYTPSSFSWKSASLIFFTVATGFLMISAKSPDSLEGKWKDNSNGGTILIYEEGGLYYGQLISADKPEENKKIQAHGKIVLMKNFERRQYLKNKWEIWKIHRKSHLDKAVVC